MRRSASVAVALTLACALFLQPLTATAQPPVQGDGVPTLTTLNLLGEAADAGTQPSIAIVEDGGVFYGTTLSGGRHGGGTLFRRDPDGTIVTLHDFNPADGDGFAPRGPISRFDSAIYGATEAGGANGLGTLYRFDLLDGEYRIAHHFDGSIGATPLGGLISDGNAMFGTASAGGLGAGTVFLLQRGSSVTRLHAFIASDCARPAAPLLQTPAGLVGSCSSGGLGDGSVFRLDTAGTLTVLHRFVPDAVNGYAGPGGNGLIAADDGTLYGSTLGDPGADSGLGRVGSLYRLTPGSAPVTLHLFSGADGALPGTLVASRDDGDRLYGTTARGGSGGGGTVFRIRPDGSAFESIVAFSPDARGGDLAQPVGLSLHPDAYFLGATFSSELPRRFGRPDPRNGDGALFALHVLAPAVELRAFPNEAAQGAPVTLDWGTEFDAQTCTAGGAWRGDRAAFGQETVSAPRPGTHEYRLECSNPAGTTTAVARLTVLPPPVISLQATPRLTSARQPTTTLTWTVRDAVNCVAEGSWSGSRSVSSTEVVTPTARGRNAYTLRCTGRGGEATATVNVTRLGTP